MNSFFKFLLNFLKDDEGATAVEYGLMVALIAIVVIISVTFLGRSLNNKFSQVGSSVGAAS
jgi:pilus assembly protein Flp/PilA